MSVDAQYKVKKQKQRLVSKLPDRCFCFDFAWLVTFNLHNHNRCPVFIHHFFFIFQCQMPQVDLIPENILIQHTQSICGKCLSCVCQTGNEWNGAVLFDLGKERSRILAKAQHSGVGNIIFRLAGLEFFLGHIQQNMEQASADTGVGHILALEQIAERR